MSRPLARKLAGACAALLLQPAWGWRYRRVLKERARLPGRYVRPNIVVVMTDDQALSQMGRRVMPKVNRLLRDHGTRFKNAFLTTPLCCPSRATLLTGQYGHNNGVLKNTYPSLRRSGTCCPSGCAGRDT